MRGAVIVFLSFTLVWDVARLAQAQQPAAQAAPAQTAQPEPSVPTGSLNLSNASLTEVVDALCRTLKINYILDPRVKGAVTINTYGETKTLDSRNLLDLILRINGAVMVQVGDLYRIVPMSDAARMPMSPNADPSKITPDEQIMLNLLFLKYASATEVSKLIEPFIGEGAKVFTYMPANLLLLLDNRRSMARTVELISLFDSDTLASQRVRLFEVKNGSPSAIAKEVEDVLKSISLTEKNSLVRFMPIDRINTIIAVAPNPGAFEEVEKWIKKLDTEIQITAGSINNYVYRVKYGRADVLAGSLMQLYGGFSPFGMGMGMGGYGGGMGGGYGGGMGGYGGGYPGAMPYGGGYAPQYPIRNNAGTAPPGEGNAATGTPGDQTGSFLQGGGMGMGGYPGYIPRIIPNPTDNTLLIQAPPQEYRQISNLLKQLDIPPRQVLIDAKIYEVSLTGSFASGVSAFLRSRASATSTTTTNGIIGSLNNGLLGLTFNTLVGQSKELLTFLSLEENATRTKVIAAPSIIATDSIAASINVGLEVPTLTSQSVTPIQSGGNSLFANTVSSRSTGVTLGITARINPSGIVTLMINQEVSAPQAPTAGSIQSPSFSRRSVTTQVTVQDGDTIAIGGIINESDGSSSAGIPLLHRLPIVGAVFGSRSYSKDRTELVIFMTPRVIYDTNQIVDASDELKGRLKRLSKMIKE